jgi:hypothetical protein
MSIEYILIENRTLLASGKFTARVRAAKTADYEAVIDHMVQRGSTVSRADIVSVLEDFCGTVEMLTLDGFNVNTPVANFHLSIQGTFDGPMDGFDPSRHRLAVRVGPGRRVRKTIPARAQITKAYVGDTVPLPKQYRDSRSQTENDRLTPGGTGWLLGKELTFDRADAQQGLFFVAAAGTATRVEEVTKNTGSEVLFLVPSLPAGVYTLEVRALFGSEDLRTGVLKASLTVL